MHKKETRRPVPAGPLQAACAAVLTLSGCATYGSVYDQEKVAVCHKGKKTLLLPHTAVDAHLGHGDTMGPCE